MQSTSLFSCSILAKQATISANRTVLQANSQPPRKCARHLVYVLGVEPAALGRKETGVVTIEGQEQRKKSEAISAVVNTVDLDYFAPSESHSSQDATSLKMIVIFYSRRNRQRYNGCRVLANQNAMATAAIASGQADRANYWCGEDCQLSISREAPQACVYLPLRQNYSDTMIFTSRLNATLLLLSPLSKNEIRNLDPALPLEDVRTGTKVIDQPFGGPRLVWAYSASSDCSRWALLR